MTNIKEIIHLYLGCEVLCNYNGKGFKAKGILSGKTISEQWEVIHDKLTFIYKYNLKNIKPILRRLDSMTEAEKIFILCSHLKDGWQPGTVLEDSDTDWAMRCTHLEYGQKTCYVSKERFPAWLFNYLLKQGFDLFGLIDSGQAIDKNLKP